MNISCIACGKVLTGTTDTFGRIDMPQCWECYANDAEYENQATAFEQAEDAYRSLFPVIMTDKALEEYHGMISRYAIDHMLKGWR